MSTAKALLGVESKGHRWQSQLQHCLAVVTASPGRSLSKDEAELPKPNMGLEKMAGTLKIQEPKLLAWSPQESLASAH